MQVLATRIGGQGLEQVDPRADGHAMDENAALGVPAAHLRPNAFGSGDCAHARLTVGEQEDRVHVPVLEGQLKGRMQAAVDFMKKHPSVAGDRIAAIGYCFGGLCVLDLARSGSSVRGVVSFHGLLGAPENLPNAEITSKVLALHGYEDPMASPENLTAFAKEMTDSKADWEVHAYGNTMHAFTNPAANDPGFGTVYREQADKRSWKAMKAFLSEVLA